MCSPVPRFGSFTFVTRPDTTPGGVEQVRGSLSQTGHGDHSKLQHSLYSNTSTEYHCACLRWSVVIATTPYLEESTACFFQTIKLVLWWTPTNPPPTSSWCLCVTHTAQLSRQGLARNYSLHKIWNLSALPVVTNSHHPKLVRVLCSHILLVWVLPLTGGVACSSQMAAQRTVGALPSGG